MPIVIQQSGSKERLVRPVSPQNIFSISQEDLGLLKNSWDLNPESQMEGLRFTFNNSLGECLPNKTMTFFDSLIESSIKTIKTNQEFNISHLKNFSVKNLTINIDRTSSLDNSTSSFIIPKLAKMQVKEREGNCLTTCATSLGLCLSEDFIKKVISLGSGAVVVCHRKNDDNVVKPINNIYAAGPQVLFMTKKTSDGIPLLSLFHLDNQTELKELTNRPDLDIKSKTGRLFVNFAFKEIKNIFVVQYDHLQRNSQAKTDSH